MANLNAFDDGTSVLPEDGLLIDEDEDNLGLLDESRLSLLGISDSGHDSIIFGVPKRKKKKLISCIPGSGLWNDIKGRYPLYISDIVDGFSTQSFAAVMYLVFACLTPAIAFGGLMSEVTDNAIGAMECIVATAICGVAFSLFSAQPLIIMGTTGPMLLFTQVLYDMCRRFGWNFLHLYSWTGIWVGLISIVLAITNASVLIHHFTPFCDEIFAALISIIFIYEAIRSVAEEYFEEPRDVAFLSTILCAVTFFLTLGLRALKKSHFFNEPIRKFFADFAAPLSLILMTLFDFIFRDVGTPKLAIPSQLTTTSGRPWIIEFWKADSSTIFIAIGPAILASLLCYLDQNITSRLINSPKWKLQKPGGYHLDLLIMGILISVCSVIGLPWLVAATVRSLSHVHALLVSERSRTPDGIEIVRIKNIKENRITNLAIHILVGLSLVASTVIKHVPMSALYGLFLYMGASSIKGNGLYERTMMFFTQPSKYPQNKYTKIVSAGKIHLFTIVQLICFGVLWAVKMTVAAIAFPIVIALLVPVRKLLLPRLFTPVELDALDGHEEE